MKWTLMTVFLAAVSLAACDSATPTTNTDTGSVNLRSDDCPEVAASGNGEPGSSHPITVELSGVPAEVDCDARVRITVFGFDRMVADVAATPMLTVVDAVPASDTLTVHLDAADFERIAFQAGVADTLGYYLDVDVDLDGDGTVCGADLSQDFDASPITFYRYADAGVATAISLKANSDPCP